MDKWLDIVPLDGNDVETTSITVRDTVYSTAMECLGPPTKKLRDWFDKSHAEIIDLIEKKSTAHLMHLHDPLSTTKKDALLSIHNTGQYVKCNIPS